MSARLAITRAANGAMSAGPNRPATAWPRCRFQVMTRTGVGATSTGGGGGVDVGSAVAPHATAVTSPRANAIRILPTDVDRRRGLTPSRRAPPPRLGEGPHVGHITGQDGASRLGDGDDQGVDGRAPPGPGSQHRGPPGRASETSVRTSHVLSSRFVTASAP